VRESNDAYYLDGELPGVDQANIDIEFTDPQTLVVKGRTERNYAPTSASPQIETEIQREPRGKDTPTSSTSTSRTPSPSWHQPTVEDDDEVDEGNVSDARSTSSSASASSKHSTSASAVIVQKPSDPAPAPAAVSSSSSSPSTDHYWIAERSIGEFQRKFAFTTRVDQDGVRAALRNGILSIVVPKEAAPKTKKIRIY
jgi:HSP20 family molecular chaperone IbpA